MGAALTLLVVLAISMVIVRIASVALRLTGLPDHVARFQSISALTGAGFTTTESEAIVNYPIRRRVIVGLMLFGNLGLISVASTFIIGFSNKVGDFNAMLAQAVVIVAAIAFIAFITSSKTLDRILCGFISRILQRLTNREQQHFHTLLALDNDYSISEHVYRGDNTHPLTDIIPVGVKINVLSVQGTTRRYIDKTGVSTPVAPNETLTCYGCQNAHHEFAKHLAATFPAHIEINK